MGLRVYYFGTKGQPGHYLIDANHRSIGHGRGRFDAPFPWEAIDGTLCPIANNSVNDGMALLHVCDGEFPRDRWTAIAFNNHTDDQRGGSNSVFFVERVWSFGDALHAAVHYFPDLVKRWPFEITRAPNTVVSRVTWSLMPEGSKRERADTRGKVDGV